MSDRTRIEASALIRPVTAEDQPPPVPSPATIVDISARGLGLRVAAGVDVTPDRLIEIGVDGRWGRARIVWSREGVRDAVIAGIELADTGIIDSLRAAKQVALAS